MDTVMFGSILSASLLGSIHCAGMCGGLVAMYAGRDSARSGIALHAAYNLGRLSIYLTLGALAGLLGAGLNLAGAMLELQSVAAIVGGLWMVAWGGQTLAKHFGLQKGGPGPLSRLSAHLVPLYRRFHEKPGLESSFAIGALSGLLPCGWLYLFVGSAAGSGHPLTGAAMMGVFWLGTLPAMASLGLLVRKLTGPLRQYLPVAAALLLVVAGLYTVSSKVAAARGGLGSFEQGAASELSPGTHLCGDHE